MNILYMVTLGAIRLFWRTFLHIVIFIRFESIKAHLKKLFDDAGIGFNGGTSHNMVVHNDELFHRIIYEGSLGLGEAYADGWWDCEKLDDFFHKSCKADLCEKVLFPWDKLINYPNFNAFNLQTEPGNKDVAGKHCDAGNHIFKAFLDENMNFSSGYWQSAENLEDAQLHKMELICRKLKLKPGMRVLDLGCGWGGLCRIMAEKYGVEVVGVTNSKECAKAARVRCKGFKVDIRCHDYREVNEVFDRVVVVGFLEHVGRKNYRSFLKLIHRCLTKDGIFLLQTIGLADGSPLPMGLFLTKYIFRNQMLPNHSDILKYSDNFFIKQDWHNFGPDYEKTLLAWNDNFVEKWPTISHMCENPKSTYRIWTYYFLMCAGIFRARQCDFKLITFKNALAPQELL